MSATVERQWEWVGDRFLRIEYRSPQPEQAMRAVLAATELCRTAPPPSLLDATPAYSTLLLSFDIETLDRESVRAWIEGSPSSGSDVEPTRRPQRVVEVPVCYDPTLAPDLESLAADRGLSVADVAAIHAAAAYSVQFIGFSPGFPYLRGLPPILATPRLDRPRTRVPAGSIGIADEQCGIYPRERPGGWRIIGRTPLSLFDPMRDDPALLRPGDQVRFRQIALARFFELSDHSRESRRW